MSRMNEQPETRQQRLSTGLVSVIIIGTALSVIGFITGRSWERQQAVGILEHQAFVVSSSLSNRVHAAIAAFRWANAVGTNAQVPPDVFAHLLQQSMQQHREVSAIYWVERVPEAAHRTGAPILQRAADGKLTPAAGRPEYFPIRLLLPDREGSNAWKNIDLGADPQLAEAIAAIRQSLEPRIHTGTRVGAGKGVQVWLPVGTPLAGIIVLDLNLDAAVKLAVSDEAVEDLDFRITAKRDGGVAQLYDSGGADPATGGRLSRRISADVLSEQWEFLCAPSAKFNVSHLPSLSLLIVGLLLTYAVSVYVRQLIEKQRQLIENEKLRAAQSMAKGTARKLRQPMTSLLLALHYVELEEEKKDEKMTEMISGMIDEMNGLLGELIQITDMDDEEMLESRLLAEVKSGATPGPPAGKAAGRRRVLVIEDEDSVRKLLELVVKDFGCEVDVVDNGDDAVERIKARNYDLVLSDIVLPGISGVEVYLQTRKVKPELEFVFLSGYPLKDEWLPVLERSAGFLSKPCGVEKINAVLSEMFPDVQAPDATPKAKDTAAS